MEPRNRCEKIPVDECELQRLSLLAKWWEDTFQKIGVDLRRETEAKEIMESIPLYIKSMLEGIISIEKSCTDEKTIHECEPKAATDDTKYVEAPQSDQEAILGKIRKPNPFLDFLKRRNPKLWRGVPQAKTFHDRADTLMKNIVEDFISWVNKTLDSDEIDDILYDDVIAMFQYDNSIVKFLRIQTVELGSVPDDPLRCCVGHSKSLRLRREILRDAEAFNRPKRTVAFGRCLPPELKSNPTRDTNFIKFATCGVSKRVKTLEGVFSGCTNLTSIKNYCKFLKENHPEVQIPKIVTKDEIYQQEAYLWMKHPSMGNSRKSSL